MTNIPIEKYRGIDIWFDKDNESFQCDIDDERSVKKSFSALKSFIDTWVKDSANFRSFTVEGNPDSSWKKEKCRIVGATKDGRFMALKANGKKEIISKYDENSYMIYNPINDPFTEDLISLSKQREAATLDFNAREKEIKSKFTIQTLKEYKDSL